MIDDVCQNKAAIIRRCLQRIDEVWLEDMERLNDWTLQDSVILNLLRACEASIDLAMHLVAREKLGIPQSSRDAIDLLESHSLITGETALKMKSMIGFRNVAVHAYQDLQTAILESILTEHLEDFTVFLKELKL